MSDDCTLLPNSSRFHNSGSSLRLNKMQNVNNYNDGYNRDFTDEDARRLVTIASSPELSAHACRWVESGKRCTAAVQGLNFPTHLRDFHGVYGVGYQSVGFLCRWENCSDSSVFTKEMLMRHIQESHLLWRWNCPNCGAVFVRRMARDTHHAHCIAPGN